MVWLHLWLPDLPAADYPASIAPEWVDSRGKIRRLAEKSTSLPGVMEVLSGDTCQVRYDYEGVRVCYRASLPKPGVLKLRVTLEGDFTDASLAIPILENDGELHPETEETDNGLRVRFPGGELWIRGGNNRFRAAGTVVNRTGSYRLRYLPFDGNELDAVYG